MQADENILQAAVEYHKSGQTMKAKCLYEKLLTRIPEEPKINYLLATILYQEGRLDKAYAALAVSLKHVPADASALCCMGHVCKKMQHWEEAGHYYNKALEQNAEYTEVLHALFDVLLQLKVLDLAKTVVQKCISLEGSNVENLIRSGQVDEAEGKLDSALKCYLEAHDQMPNHPRAQFHMASVYKEQGKLDWAEQGLKQALRQDPKSIDVTIALGELLESRGDAPTAEKAYRDAYIIDPDAYEPNWKLGQLCEANKRYAEAVVFYEHCTRRNPNDYRAHEALGRLLMSMGHGGKAETFLETAVKLNAESFQAHSALAQIRLPGDHYYTHLKKFHDWLKPQTYVEIGLETGISLAMANAPTECIGIDPEPLVIHSFHTKTRIYDLPSDDFFEKHNLVDCFGGKRVEFAFIDGLHVFEQALKDFMNIERVSTPDTVVVVHDCMPLDDWTASRERKTKFWSGDPWKVIACLREHRPDLRVATIPAFPTGLGIITGLDPNSCLLDETFDAVVQKYIPMEYSDLSNPYEMMNVIENDWSSIQTWVKHSRNTVSA